MHATSGFELRVHQMAMTFLPSLHALCMHWRRQVQMHVTVYNQLSMDQHKSISWITCQEVLIWESLEAGDHIFLSAVGNKIQESEFGFAQPTYALAGMMPCSFLKLEIVLAAWGYTRVMGITIHPLWNEQVGPPTMNRPSGSRPKSRFQNSSVNTSNTQRIVQSSHSLNMQGRVNRLFAWGRFYKGMCFDLPEDRSDTWCQ